MDEDLEIITPPEQAIEIVTPEEPDIELVQDVLYVEILQPPSVFIEIFADQKIEEIEVISGVPIYIISEGSGTMVFGETPTGIIDGLNLAFATSFKFQMNGLLVYLNGLRQRYPLDFGVTGEQSFQFSDAPQIGDSVRVDYLRL